MNDPRKQWVKRELELIEQDERNQRKEIFRDKIYMILFFIFLFFHGPIVWVIVRSIK
jgi:hypothetical protein